MRQGIAVFANPGPAEFQRSSRINNLENWHGRCEGVVNRRNGPSKDRKTTQMTRTNDLTARFFAFAGALLLATISLAASVGPAMTNLTIA